MLKHVLNQYIKGALGEVFVDPEAHLEATQTNDYGSQKRSAGLFRELLSMLTVNDQLTFSNLTFKPDIFDILLHPVTLISGSVGRLKLTGLANAYVGGSLTLRVDNLFLLFKVDAGNEMSDPEKAHILKKLYLELQRRVLSDSIVTSLVYKLFNIPYNGDSEAAKKERQVYLSGVKHLLRTLQVVVKTIHIRIESDSPETGTGAGTVSSSRSRLCSAIGVSLPSLTIGSPKTIDATAHIPAPMASTPVKGDKGRGGYSTPKGSKGAKGRDTPNTKDVRTEGGEGPARVMRRPPRGDTCTLRVACKALQLYVDYGCESYMMRGYSAEDIHHLFAAKWKSEVHTGLLLPFDLSVSLTLAIDGDRMTAMPSMEIDVPQFHVACDPKQLEVIMAVVGSVSTAVNRARAQRHLTRCGVMVGGYQLPLLIERTSASRGRHVLPMLSLGGASSEGIESRVYPNDTLLNGVSRRVVDNTRSSFVMRLPKGGSRGIVSYLKERVGPNRWVRVMWKYVVQIVIHDLRSVLPLGRWRSMIDLVWSRKEYAYMYSKLLKPSSTSNQYIYMPNKDSNPYELMKIHQYEMVLPVSTILAFRSAATAVAAATHIRKTLYEASHPYIATESSSGHGDRLGDKIGDKLGGLDGGAGVTHPALPSNPTRAVPNDASTASKRGSGWKHSLGSMGNAFDKITHNSSHSASERPPVAPVGNGGASSAAAAISRPTGGEFENSIKFAKEVKKALTKVRWGDIVSMLTQLEKLSEGGEGEGSSPREGEKGNKADPTATPFTMAERLTRVRTGVLLNPSILTSRYDTTRPPMMGQNHYGYPTDIKPTGEVLAKYSNYSFLEEEEGGGGRTRGRAIQNSMSSFQSHSLSSAMDTLLQGQEALPALWLMDYNSEDTEGFETPVRKDQHGDSAATARRVPLLKGINTLYSGPILGANGLADDLLSPTSFLMMHTDPTGVMGSDVMLSESVKRSAARLKRMSAREKEQRERERSREGTPQRETSMDSSSHDASHLFGGFKKALGSATKKSISVLTLGSVHGNDMDETQGHVATLAAMQAASAAKEKAFDTTLGEDSEDYHGSDIDLYDCSVFGIESEDELRRVKAMLHMSRPIHTASNIKAVLQSVLSEPAVPYTEDRIYLADSMVQSILERHNLRLQLSLPNVNLHVSSVMFNMREAVDKQGINHVGVATQRSTFLTVSFNDIDCSLNASPSVPPPVATAPRVRRKSRTKPSPAAAAAVGKNTTDNIPKGRRFSLNPVTWGKPFARGQSGAPHEGAKEEAPKVSAPPPKPLAMGGMPVMGCPLRHYSHVPQAVDLSGLLIIVKVSISTMRVCTYISPLEFQGARTNGVTAAIPPVSSGGTSGVVPIGASRRKSTTGYHTPFASEPPAVAKLRRVSEITIEEDKDRASPKESNDMDTVSIDVESVGMGTAEDGSYQGNAYRTGARKIQWSTDDLIKPADLSTAATGAESAEEAGTTTAAPGAATTSGAPSSTVPPRDPKEDIMMCVLDSEGTSADKALNLCVIVDFPPKALGVAVEAVDVQCALGALAVNIGRNELCVLLSPANTTLCRRVGVALQGMLNLSGVLAGSPFLLRDFSHPNPLRQHLPVVLLGSGSCTVANHLKAQTERAVQRDAKKGTAAGDGMEGYRSFLRTRDRALGENGDILRHLNYARYYNLLSQRLPNTLSVYLRTGEVNATLFSAAMVKSFITNVIDLVSCKAVDGYVRDTVDAGREYVQKANKASLVAIHGAVLCALDVLTTAADNSQRNLEGRREQWACNNTAGDRDKGLLGYMDHMDRLDEEELSVSAPPAPPAPAPVLFTLDEDEAYAVPDNFNTSVTDRMANIYSDKNSDRGYDRGADGSELNYSRHSSHSDKTKDPSPVSTGAVIVRQMKLTIPSFNFELNKSITATENADASYEEINNIESIYGVLSVKLLGIGLSIPMDDSSLCQLAALALSRYMPIYPLPSSSGGRSTGGAEGEETTLAERGLRRGLFESAPPGSTNVVLPEPILPADVSAVPIHPFDDEAIYKEEVVVKEEQVDNKKEKGNGNSRSEDRGGLGMLVKGKNRNTYTQTEQEYMTEEVVVKETVTPAVAVQDIKKRVDVIASPAIAPAASKTASAKLFGAMPDTPPHTPSEPVFTEDRTQRCIAIDVMAGLPSSSAWGGERVSFDEAVTAVELTPELTVAAETSTASTLAPILFNASTPAIVHYTAASEDDVTPPGSPHYEDREDANMAVGANGINGELDDTPVMNGEDGGEITPCASPELPEGPQVQPERVAGRDLAEEGRFAEEHTAVADGHAEPASTDPASVVPEVAVGMDGHDEAHTQDTERDRPRLGTTVPKQKHREPIPHSWRPVKASTFQVRCGPNYKRNKHKAGSERALYDPIAVDVFRVDQPVSHISSRVSFPDVEVSAGESTPFDALLPAIVVVQLMVPREAPTMSMFGGHSEDGPGYAVIITFRITEATRASLSDLPSAPPAVRHFLNYCKAAHEDPEVKGLLKVICRCPNADKVDDLSSVVSSYSNTPTVLKRTTSIYHGQRQGQGDGYMEIDINVYQFSTLVKRTIHGMLSCAGEMQLQMGLIIEGTLDEELPECLFGVVELCKPQDDQVVALPME